MENKFLYVYNVTEHERGWGTRPDGYMCFIDQETAESWLKETYSKRSMSVPDCYDSYDNPRWEPVHESLYEQVKLQGHGWVRDLKIVLEPTKTKTLTLEWTLELDQDDSKLTDLQLFEKYFKDIVPIGNLSMLIK